MSGHLFLGDRRFRVEAERIADAHVTAARISPTRWFQRPWILVSAVILSLGLFAFAVSDSVRFVVLSNVSLCLYGMPTPKDRQDADVVVDVIKGAHKFTHKSVSQPGYEPVFVTPGSRLLIVQPIVVSVYDVTSRDNQNKIVDAVRNLVVRRLLMPVEISFIDHENWIVDGPNSGHRGPETQLRKVYITRSHIRDHTGNKLVNYPTV